MTEDIVAYYQQLLGRYPASLEQAVCVTYVQGIDEDAFIRAFGGDPAATEPRTLADLGDELSAYRYDEVPSALLVTTVGSWVVGIEDNGFQGSRPVVMRGASAGGTAVSVFWNVNGANEFTYNVAGRRIVSFDMEMPDDLRWGAVPDALDALVAGLPFGEGSDVSWPAGLALAERVTGVRLDVDLLERRFRRAFLSDVPDDLVPEGSEDDPALDDPFVRAVLAEPTRDKLPGIARHLAHLVAEDAGVRDEPAVAVALSIVDERATGRPVTADGAVLVRLAGLADGFAAASREDSDPEAFRRMHAVRAVLGALSDDPAEAAFQVHWYGGYALRDRRAALVSIVLDHCRSRALATDHDDA